MRSPYFKAYTTIGVYGTSGVGLPCGQEALFFEDSTCSGHTACSVGGLEQNAKSFRARVEVVLKKLL